MMFSQYMQISILMLLLLCGSLSDSIFSVLLPNIQTSLNIDIALSQVLFSTVTLGVALGMLFWGQLADLLGRRRALNLGIITYILSIIASAYCQCATVFFIIRFIQGFAGSVTNVMALVMIRDWFPETATRSRMQALVNQSFAFGPLIGYLISLLPIPGENWRYTYLALAFFYFPIWLIMQRLTFKSHQRVGHFSFRQTLGVLQNKKMRISSFLIGSSISIGLCYLSNMPYILKNVFNLPHWYAPSLIALGIVWFASGMLAMILPKYFRMKLLLLAACLNLLLCSLSMIIVGYLPLDPHIQAFLYLSFSLAAMLGTGVIIPHAIGKGLEPFGESAGKAAAVLGFNYYLIAMLIQNLLASLPHGNIFSMPLLFIVLSLFMTYLVAKMKPSSTAPVDKTVENSNSSGRSPDGYGITANLHTK